MSIEVLQAHYGFTRMPFRRDLAPQMLHRTAGHNEAVARITWCIAERALGVVTGEVGSGKTVATRAATSEVDASRHSVIYLGNPAVGARGLYSAIVHRARWGSPVPQGIAHPTDRRRARRRRERTWQTRRRGR